MIILCMFFIVSVFLCEASEGDIVDKAVRLFIAHGTIDHPDNPIATRAIHLQVSLYTQVAKKIVLEALKADPLLSPKNVTRVNYPPDFKWQEANPVQDSPIHARIETAWEGGQGEPKIFLFYKAPGRLVPGTKQTMSQNIHSFDGKFYHSARSTGILDMSISPDGNYTATLTSFGCIKIRMVGQQSSNEEDALHSYTLSDLPKDISRIAPVGFLRWFNKGKGIFCVFEHKLYELCFDPAQKKIFSPKLLGTILTKNDAKIIVKDLLVESNTGDTISQGTCSIAYIEDNEEKVWLHSDASTIPSVHVVHTHLGDRALVLSSPTSLLSGLDIVFNDVVTGFDIATVRNLKELGQYSAVTVDEQHNVVYLFKNENQNIKDGLGFIPVIESAHFVPTTLNTLIQEFNSSMIDLTRVKSEVGGSSDQKWCIKGDTLIDAILKNRLVLKKDVQPLDVAGVADIDIDATAKQMITKALAIYRTAVPAQTITITQPENTYMRYLYDKMYTWYMSCSNTVRQWSFRSYIRNLNKIINRLLVRKPKNVIL